MFFLFPLTLSHISPSVRVINVLSQHAYNHTCLYIHSIPVEAVRENVKRVQKQTSCKIFLHYTNAEDFPRTRTFHGFSRAQPAFSWHFH